MTLNRERVIEAAVTLADADGLAALSMRALGDLLGVKAMSLYHHVASKEVLLDAMVDRVVGEIDLPAPEDDWRPAMRARARSTRVVLRRHPWACGLLMSRVNVGPATLRAFDATLACLFRGGFSLPMADQARNVLDAYTYGFTLQELNFPLAKDDYAMMAAAYLPMLPGDRYPSMRALTVEVAEGRYDGQHELGFGLEVLLDGLTPDRPHVSSAVNSSG